MIEIEKDQVICSEGTQIWAATLKPSVVLGKTRSEQDEMTTSEYWLYIKLEAVREDAVNSDLIFSSWSISVLAITQDPGEKTLKSTLSSKQVERVLVCRFVICEESRILRLPSLELDLSISPWRSI
jgi:hypothetical protein